jgi:hypothetical protein
LVFYKEDIFITDKLSPKDNTYFLYINEESIRVESDKRVDQKTAGQQRPDQSVEKYNSMCDKIRYEKALLMDLDLPTPQSPHRGHNPNIATIDKIRGDDKISVVHFQHQNGSKFRFRKFSRKIDFNLLYGGDIIWIHHFQYELNLVASRKKHSINTVNNHEQVFLPYNIKYQQEEKQFNKYKSYGGSNHGLWCIENINFKDGGPLLKNVGVRLRHLESGYYLGINLKDKTLLLERDHTERNVFYFLSNENDGSMYIKQNSVIKIMSAWEMLTLKAIPNDIGYVQDEYADYDLPFQENFAVTPKTMHNYMIWLEKTTTDLDSFSLKKPETNHLIETNFLLNIFPVFTDIHDSLDRDKEKSLLDRSKVYNTHKDSLRKIIQELS